MSDWIKEMPKMQIEDICNAYESAYGKGLYRRELSNPYEDNTPSAKAWDIGMKAGLAQNHKEMSAEGMAGAIARLKQLLVSAGLHPRMVEAIERGDLPPSFDKEYVAECEMKEGAA